MNRAKSLVCLLVALLVSCGGPSTPAAPTPTGGGGTAATTSAPVVPVGGATVALSVIGGSPALGGASAVPAATTTTTSAIVWPTCPKQARRLAASDRDRYKRTLGRRQDGPIAKRRLASYQALDLPDVFWTPTGPALDQDRPWLGPGQGLGSCTGNFAVNVRLSHLWAWPSLWPKDAIGLENAAVGIYSAATKIDPFDGSWEPDDTGSNSASVLAIMRKQGLVSGWITVQSFDGLQRQLQKGPCGFGSNWYSSMYVVQPGGNIDVSGTVDGGHQYTVRAFDYKTKRVLFENSWGNDFGCSLNGRGGLFYMTFGNVQRLISEGADMDCPYLSNGAANDNGELWAASQ